MTSDLVHIKSSMKLSRNTYEYIYSSEGGVAMTVNYVNLDSSNNEYSNNKCGGIGCVFAITASLTLIEDITLKFDSDEFTNNEAVKIFDEDLESGACLYVSSNKAILELESIFAIENQAESGSFLQIASMQSVSI